MSDGQMKRGDWVITRENPFQLGTVRKAYSDPMGEGDLIDIVLYDPQNGEAIGRESPSEGGPTTFEPACQAENWTVIPAPMFPLRRVMDLGPDFGSYRPILKVHSAPNRQGDAENG